MNRDFDFDPFDERFFDDPYPAYRVLREQAPVYRRPTADAQVWPHYWMLTRARDVNRARSDWRTFSSARGTLIDTDISLIPPNIFNMDPPRHDELRDILARVLTPARVAALAKGVRESAESILEPLVEAGTLDAATDYAQQIPTLMMCELMDLPTSDRKQFLKWNMDTLAGADFTSEAALSAYAEMGTYWQGLVAERRKHRANDLISEILHYPVTGVELSTEEVAGFCSLLHDASQNTTMNMIANASIQIPVGGPIREGIAAIDAFYRENELAETLEVVGPVCAAANEAAVQMIARVRRDGVLLELDVIDMATIDERGRLLSMRAFFDLDGARVLEGR